VCGLDDCEPCAACTTLRCIAGTWRKAETPEVRDCTVGPAGDDTVAGDAIAYACDSIGYLDGYSGCGAQTQPEPEPMVSVRCLDNPEDIREHPCTAEGETCGLEACADPCAHCRFTVCQGGLWAFQDVLPLSTCYAPAADVAEGPGGCALWGCGSAPPCGVTYDSECGSCACTVGDLKCGGIGGDDTGSYVEAVLTCTGTCYEAMPCAADDACADGGPMGVKCVADLETCAEVEAYLLAAIERAQVCTESFYCGVSMAACAPGNRRGWIPTQVDPPGPIGFVRFDNLILRWLELGCDPSGCDPHAQPGLAPATRCIGGLCSFVE
jgi:hypothetical protein